MDGDNVSTGTVERLVEMYNATESARIAPELSEKVRELENAYDNELIGLDSDTLDRRADESDEFTS